MLARVLEALAEVDHPAGGFEVIVVDDGSVDDTASVVAAASQPVVFIHQANAGEAVAPAGVGAPRRANCSPAPSTVS